MGATAATARRSIAASSIGAVGITIAAYAIQLGGMKDGLALQQEQIKAVIKACIDGGGSISGKGNKGGTSDMDSSRGARTVFK